MQKTTFHISKMDCPAEERMIRMKLEGMPGIHMLTFDIPDRRLDVYHEEDYQNILTTLHLLQLDTRFVSSAPAEIEIDGVNNDHKELIVLRQVLAINLLFFVLELLFGLIAASMGLIADSLDMLADSIVYGLSLFAVGGTVARKKNIAKVAGYFQLALALLGFAEVVRRFLGYGESPDFRLMIAVSIFALAGNALCLYLLQRAKSAEAHMQASMIFTSMDVIANLGVIGAGILVYLTGSLYPDLVVGAVVFMLVARGAYRILQLSK